MSNKINSVCEAMLLCVESTNKGITTGLKRQTRGCRVSSHMCMQLFLTF